MLNVEPAKRGMQGYCGDLFLFSGMFCALVTFITHGVNGTQENTGVQRCGKPRFENGKLYPTKDMYEPDDEVRFNCNHHYNLTEEVRIKCRPNGTWSACPPFCIEIVCSQLPHLPNGTITPNPKTSKIGSSVSVSCAEGFELIGKDTLTCNIHGNWDPDTMLYCKKITCPPITAIQNGNVKVTDSSVTFTCYDGYTLEGSHMLNCTDEGNWTPNEMPHCRETVCCRLPKLQNGNITPNPRTSKIGSKVQATCDEGFELIGNDTLRCTIVGIWHPDSMLYCARLVQSSDRPATEEEANCSNLTIAAVSITLVVAGIISVAIIVCWYYRKHHQMPWT